jgi:hypothetical protein
MMTISSFWRTLLYFLFFTRTGLLKRLETELCCSGTLFNARFSGRAALAELAKSAFCQTGRKKVLLPDYICNVVVKAVIAAGGEPEFYKLNEKFEPDEASVARLVEQKCYSVLLVASLYGADGGCGWIEQPLWRSRLALSGTAFIADLCQDFFRAKALSQSLIGTNGYILISFNNKSFPGMMGGGFIGRTDDESGSMPCMRISLKQHLYLVRRFLSTGISASWRQFNVGRAKPTPLKPIPPDYGACSTFPFKFLPYNIAREQLAAACAGISLLHKIQKSRINRLDRLRGFFLATPGVERSPFVVLIKPVCKRVRQKAPFALENQPKCSLRNDLIIIHNKGFQDV